MSADPGMQYSASPLPWTTNQYEELEQGLSNLYLQADLINRRWAQKWWENFQFVLGNQSLRWSRQFDFAMDTDFLTDGYREDNRGSQTNISRTVLESLAAMIYSNLPQLEFNARYDNSSRGTRLSKTVEKITECYNERLNLHDEFDFCSVLFVMYAKAYSKVSWNKLAGPTFKRPQQRPVQVPKMQIVLQPDPVTGEDVQVPVPVIDETTGQPVMFDSFEDVTDQFGNIVYEDVTTGDVAVEMLSPFEIVYDQMAKTFNKTKWIGQIRVMDYDDFMIEYADQPGVIQSEMNKVQGGFVQAPLKAMAIRHFLRTMFAIPPCLNDEGNVNLSSLYLLKNKVLVIEHYDRPSRGHAKNPTPWLAQGRRCVMANGRLVLVSTPQYRLNTPSGWHPFSECKWLPLAPSIASSGPMSDTIQKNRELNLTDTLMSLSLQRTAGATVLVNDQSGLDKEKLTGIPGLSLYVSGDPSSAAYYLSDKNPLPNLTHQYRAQVKDDVYEVSGAQDSIRGERSVGATSGIQAEILQERERKRTSKASNNWESSLVKSTYEKILACLQQNAAVLDQSVIARIQRSAEGEISEGDVMAFLKGPMDFGVDVTLVSQSMQTKSKASKAMNMNDALRFPAVAQRLINDESVVDEYLDFLGIDTLRDESSYHRERAKKENSCFNDALNIKDPNVLATIDLPLVIWQDIDMIHMIEHRKDVVKNYDKYMKNPALLKIAQLHYTKHEQNWKAKQDQQDPVVARYANLIYQRAEQSAQGEQDWMTRLKDFRARKLQEQMQAMQMAADGAQAGTTVNAQPQPEAAPQGA